MNKNPEVDAWLAKYDNPKKAEVEAIREIILAADPNMTEDIKWSAPNFMYNGNLCTFNPRAKKAASLLFHTGASMKDELGLLKGDGATARSASFEDMDDVKAKKEALEAIVKEWVALKS